MSKTMSIAATTTWGPERHRLATVIAALIGVAWALTFAGSAQARVILDDTSVREARSYDISGLQASIRADGWDGDHAATLKMLTDPSYGDPQPQRDFTPVETQGAEIDDGVDLGLVSVATVGLLAVALLATRIARRRAMSPA
jgi:hypothetical protein